ncbi:hypothetical protein MMC25_000324 [Agyrium rufum]|nr:hypothetical protein [Agyrium rufum]
MILPKQEETALRAHLLAYQRSQQAQSQGEARGVESSNSSGSPGNSAQQSNIDPAIANGGGMLSNNSAGESGGDDNDGGKKGQKRELSTSKRAAQNRAAQRAFRQRKEGHIKKLEEQVRDYNLLTENYKALQTENYRLRDYIISLQRRLIDTQGEVPQPPSDIDFSPQPTRHLADPASAVAAVAAAAAAAAQAENQSIDTSLSTSSLSGQPPLQSHSQSSQVPTASMTHRAGPYDHRMAMEAAKMRSSTDVDMTTSASA